MTAGGLRRNSRLKWLGWTVFLLAVGSVGGWAARALLEPPEDVLTAPSYTVVSAREGSVGQSIGLRVSASWPAVRQVAAEASGVVTSMDASDGDELQAGDAPFTVNLRPLVVAEGSTPMFRPLGPDARGPDVGQLQRFLKKAGFKPGAVNEHYDKETTSAVRRWHKKLGQPGTGTVDVTDLVFVQDLPARVRFSEQVRVGNKVNPGDVVFEILPRTPTFTLVLPPGQTDLVESGQDVTLSFKGSITWYAKVTEVGSTQDDTGQSVAQLGPSEGQESICVEECNQVPVSGTTLIPGQVQVVPKVSGIVVPVSAVVTTADGQQAVVMDDGSLRPITVVSASFGSAVVQGLGSGDHVRAPGLLPTDSDVGETP